MDEGGRWCLTVVMDDCCGSSGQWTIDTAFNGGGGGGVQWRRQHLMVFDGFVFVFGFGFGFVFGFVFIAPR
jgi:hypothetical protein